MGIPPVTPVATIDATGLHLPDFNQVLQYFMTGYQGIYGSDVYLENDSQDGQLLSLFALAVDDLNSAIGAAYNSYSPSTAQGIGLSQAVKINGMAREVPSNSTCDIYCVGVAGTELVNAYVTDAAGNQWFLPSLVIIDPVTGDVTATATCGTTGAVEADPNTITGIGTPTLGWQTATNLAPATPGQPVETDAALRNRQADSTMLPSLTVLDGIQGALEGVPGVAIDPSSNTYRVRIYENDTSAPVLYTPNSTPFPPHSISAVIDGGDADEIANIIATKKTPGAYTNGTTAIPWMSPFGIPETIRFSRPIEPVIIYEVTLYALNGFTQLIQDQIAQTLSDWTNALGIGGRVDWVKSLVPAQLYGQMPQSSTFEIVSVQLARQGQSLDQNDIVCMWNEAPSCDPTQVSFVIPPTPYRARTRRR